MDESPTPYIIEGEARRGAVGPFVGIIIVVILMIVGGIYFFVQQGIKLNQAAALEQSGK